MVNFLFAVEASISHWALTEVTTFRVVSTTPTVKTGSICTSVGTQLTVVAIKTRRTGALVAVFIVLYAKKKKKYRLNGHFGHKCNCFRPSLV